MSSDPIVAQVRELREMYASRFGYDLASICRDLREQHRLSGKTMVRRKPIRLSETQKSDRNRVRTTVSGDPPHTT